MNLILLTPGDFGAAGRALLRGERAAHILEVLKARPGDEFKVGELGGCIGRGRVVSVAAGRVELEVELLHEPPPPLPVCLLLALPRPKVLRRTLAAAITLGVKDIYLLNAFRVEKSYWQTPWLKPVALEGIVLAALSQAVDTIPPTIELHRRFRPFVEDRLPELARGYNALLLHPDPVLPTLSSTPAVPALVAIGPEGGFIPFEVERLQRAGLAACSYGPRILRVEQVVSALLGRFLG